MYIYTVNRAIVRGANVSLTSRVLEHYVRTARRRAREFFFFRTCAIAPMTFDPNAQRPTLISSAHIYMYIILFYIRYALIFHRYTYIIRALYRIRSVEQNLT